MNAEATPPRLARALELVESGDNAEALALLDAAPCSVDERCLWISIARMLDRNADAERELDALLRKHPQNARANHLCAMALIDARQFDDAMPHLERALANYPESAKDERSELHADWGNLHYERGDTVRAVIEWRKALRLAPNNTVAEHNLREFEDVRFERCNTVNEMILAAAHPAQVLAYLLPAQTFGSDEEAEAFADDIMNLWNTTPRPELGGRSPVEAANAGIEGPDVARPAGMKREDEE